MATSDRAGPKPPSSTSGSDRRIAVGFLLPGLVLVAALVYLPMGRAVYDSLFDTGQFSPRPRFVGVSQYIDTFTSPIFRQIIRNSVVWTVGVVALQNALGLGAAVLLNQRLPLRRLTRTVVLLPWILPGIVGALLWRFMLDPQLGLINGLLSSAGVTHQNVAWLGDTTTAMGAVIFAATWKGFPFSAMIYLAALQNVDRELLEAATVDGATAWHRFRHVTLPSISGVARLNVLLTTIFTFNYFDLIWITTKGGPLNSTHIFPTYIFQLGFGEFRYGPAAVYGVVAAVILAIVGVLYLRELRPTETI